MKLTSSKIREYAWLLHAYVHEGEGGASHYLDVTGIKGVDRRRVLAALTELEDETGLDAERGKLALPKPAARKAKAPKVKQARVAVKAKRCAECRHALFLHITTAGCGRCECTLPVPALETPKAVRKPIARTVRPPSKAKLRSLRKKLHAKAWKLWSAHVRSCFADSAGMAECFTCRRIFPWREMHASHFIHRKLDFDPRNIQACCAKCNCFLHGNLGAFALRLVDEYGRDAVDELRAMAEQHQGYNIEELEAIVVKYTGAK